MVPCFRIVSISFFAFFNEKNLNKFLTRIGGGQFNFIKSFHLPTNEMILHFFFSQKPIPILFPYNGQFLNSTIPEIHSKFSL